MRVGIVGAGAIGGYLAAKLAASGTDVVLLTRPGHTVEPPVAVQADGLVFKAPDSLHITADQAALGGVSACVVAVKSSATSATAARLSGVLPKDAVVVTLQNGLRNAETLREALGMPVAAGIVTYNVYIDPQGRRQQATRGKLYAGALPSDGGRRLSELSGALKRAQETLEIVPDIDRLILGKLLINLNNGVCAVTGLGIAAALADKDARACYAACLKEGLSVMRRAGLSPGRVTAIPPSLLPAVMQLPDALVSRLARLIAGVRPDARFSTLQDLDKGRPTEIDELNGAIVALAERHRANAPVNALVTSAVHAHERAIAAGERLEFLSPRALREKIEAVAER